jgi:hypothetical protein
LEGGEIMRMMLRAMATLLFVGAAGCGSSEDFDEAFNTETGVAVDGLAYCSEKAASFHHNCEGLGGTAGCGSEGGILTCSCSVVGGSQQTTCTPDNV